MKASTLLALALGLLACLFCFLCICLAWLVVNPAGLTADWLTRGDRILLGLPDRGGESDLVLLRLGQPPERGRILAEDVGAGSVGLTREPAGIRQSLGGSDFGGFLPGGDELLLQTSDNDETIVRLIPLRWREPRTIFETEALQASALIRDPDRGIIFTETRDGRARCWVSQDAQAAERVASGDRCEVTPDGLAVLVADSGARGLDLAVLNLDGGREVQLLEDVEGVLDFQMAADGSRVAYTQEDEQGRIAVHLIRRQDGGHLASGVALDRLLAFGFAPRGHRLYYFGENTDGEIELHLLDGEDEWIAAGFGMQAGFAASGEDLVYLVSDEGGRQELRVRRASDGADLDLVGGENLAFALLPAPDRVLITDHSGGALTVYSARIGEETTVEILHQTNATLQQAMVLPGEPRLYLVIADAEGRQSLFVSPIDRETGWFALEDWAEIRLLNRWAERDLLALALRDDPGDPVELHVLELREEARSQELDDDAEGIRNAVFTADGSWLLYTAVTGAEADEVEVRRVRPDGRERPEALYPEAELLDVRWDRLRPFAGAVLEWQVAVGGTGFCPDFESIEPGESLEDELVAGGQNCYRLRLGEPGEYALRVTSPQDVDTWMDLYDREGLLLASDDDSGPGLSPRLRYQFEVAGVYFVTIRGYHEGAAGAYTLTVDPGGGTSLSEIAAPLPFDTPTWGAVTDESSVYLEELDYEFYGAVYSFEGAAGDWIEIHVAAPSIGSLLEPTVVLLDSTVTPLTYASPDFGRDLDLGYSLPTVGLYYIVLSSITEGFGTGQDYFFEITLHQGTPPPPGGGPISMDEPEEAYVYTEAGDLWTFTGAEGELVTILMVSDTLDTYLELRGPTGTTLITDDDSGGDLDARISDFRLPESGTYTIVARGYGGSLGPYTLSLARGEPPQAITIGQTVSAVLPLQGSGQWTFTATAGTAVTIRMTSAAFDSYLELYGPDGSWLIGDDDGAGFPNAQITDFVLPATGEYRIVASSLGGGGSGQYTLTVE